MLKSVVVTPLGITALLFFVALLLAEAAVRVLRVPRITALVVAGLLIGVLRRNHEAAALMPLPRVLLEALAMVLLFEVGQRVPLGWLRRNLWLAAASFGECAVTFTVIYAVLALGFAIPPFDCAFVAVICMTASPIVVMSVSKDLGARGQVSERSLLYCTLSSVYAVLLVQFLVAGYRAAAPRRFTSVVQPLYLLAGSFLLGVAAAAALRLYAFITRSRGRGRCSPSASFCCCVLLYAYAPPLGCRRSSRRCFFGLIVRGTDRTHSVLSHQTSETGAVLTFSLISSRRRVTPLDRFRTLAGAAAAVAVARLLAKVGANAVFAHRPR